MKNKIVEILRKYTKHDNIFLTSRGNKAILAALKILKNNNVNKILVPDQGAWFTYTQYAKKLKFDVKILKTDYGVIDLDVLKENAKADVLIYSNPAAYYAEQPIKEIYDICRDNKIIVILDISGCIGSDFYHGNYADMTVCSFGKWKPINLGYGGFISLKDKKISEKIKDYLKKLEFDEDYYSLLFEKLERLKNWYDILEKINKRIKDDLKHFEILHKDKKGLNVIVKFNSKKEKTSLIEYCEKNKYEFVVCPKSIKVNEDAISIEVKRLE